MMRLILGVIAFVLSFGSSVTLVGLLFGFPQADSTETGYTNSYTTRKIERLLKRDLRNGYFRNRKILRMDNVRYLSDAELYQQEEYRSAVARYVYNSASMSDAGLPEDFQYAWRNHMKAWKKQTAYLNTLNNVRFGSGDAIAKGYSDNTYEINQTWYQVLRIARRYGVKVDRSYYR